MTSPAARVVFGQETATPRLSVTWTLDRVVWPELVTTYSQSTGAPTWICGPGAVSASSPFVYFLMRIADGCGSRSEERRVGREWRDAVSAGPLGGLVETVQRFSYCPGVVW